MKKTIAVLVLAAFVTTGCTGSFNLTKKVYNFHRSKQPDKWADELGFLVVALLPIYGFATFADAIVFNSIEFWTGENPVAYNPGDQKIKTVQNGKDKIILSYNPKTDEIAIIPQKNQKQNLTLARFDDGSVAIKDQKGELLYISKKNPNGDISIFDKNDKLVKNFSAEEVSLAKQASLSN